jgi:hypothetical protein
MKIQEFIRIVELESERATSTEVRLPSSQTLALAAKPGGMLLTDWIMAVPQSIEQKTFRYRHLLGPPAQFGAIDEWVRAHPKFKLPDDLMRIVQQVNGIHLWANIQTGRSLVGLAPIEEWDAAQSKMCGAPSEHWLLGERYIAITYDQSFSAFVVLDGVSGTYFLMDVSVSAKTSLTPSGISIDR